MRAVFAIALVATLIVAAQGQMCNFNGNSFTLPNFGTYAKTNDQYQTYGQYVPVQPGLTGNRLWQMNLCGVAANDACQNGNIQAPQSYIYELNRADGSKGSCDMGLSSFGGWFQSTALDANNKLVTSMNGTFMNTAQNRVAQVAIICGGTTNQLNPVNFPGANNGWYTYPNSAQSIWTWDVVFQYPVPGMCSGPQPPAPPPATPVPGTPPTPQPPATPQPPPGPTDKPSEEEKSSAAAIIFVVLVFVLPVFYVAGTVAYNYLRLGKRGWELAPHPEFWKDFPHLCLDGCRFVKDKFLQLIGKGGSGEEYSKL